MFPRFHLFWQRRCPLLDDNGITGMVLRFLESGFRLSALPTCSQPSQDFSVGALKLLVFLIEHMGYTKTFYTILLDCQIFCEPSAVCSISPARRARRFNSACIAKAIFFASVAAGGEEETR